MRPTQTNQLSTESSVPEFKRSDHNKSSKSSISQSKQVQISQTKTPFQSYPQKPIWVSEQESVNNEEDDIPKLVVYRDSSRSHTLNQFGQFLQRDQTQNIPKKPIRSISRTEKSPTLTEKKQTYSQILIQSPDEDKEKPSANHKLTELMESNQKLQENFTKKEEDPIDIRTKPKILLNDQNAQKKSHFESEKLIEEFLRNLSPQLNYQEIENLSDAMVEKQIQNCDDDKIVLSNKIKQLRTETKHLTRNDIKYKYLNSEIELLSDKLLLTEKVINLFRDKLTLRAQIQNQKTLLNQLGDRIIQMETNFTEQIHQLKTYNATLPTERERNLENENKKLQKKLDQEYLLRQELENGIQVNITTFQNLFNEAEQAKKHIIDQLKFVKDKRDDLNHQLKLAEEVQQMHPKSQNKTEQLGQSQKVGFSFLNPQQSHRHSIAHQMQGSVMSSSSSKQQSTAQGQQNHLSKIIQKNVLSSLQGQESFVKSDKNAQNNVLSGLNQPEAKQTQSSLATIKENDQTSPKSYGEENQSIASLPKKTKK